MAGDSIKFLSLDYLIYKMFDYDCFNKMIDIMKTDKYEGWITWAEANIECGLPERYKRSTQVPYFYNDIIAIKPKDRNETVYYLRRGNESIKST